MSKKTFYTAVSMVTMLFSCAIVFSENIGKSIAVVNGEAIYSSEFDNNWSAILQQREKMGPDEKASPDWDKENRKALLDQMIEEKLLLQEAKRRNIKVPKRQLEEGILQVKNRFKILPPGAKPGKEDYERELTSQEQAEFLKELKTQELTEKDFGAKIEDQLRVMRLTEEEVKSKIPEPFADNKGKADDVRDLTPDYEKEAKVLYAQIEKKYNQPDFKPDPENELDQMVMVLKSKLGETVRANHILIKSSRKDDLKTRTAALNKIKAIKKQLDEGADFVDLAKTKSEGPSAKDGGDLGFFTRGQMLPEFEKAAFALPVGGISDVVETEFGYHIIQVVEKKAPRKLRYDDIKADLAGYIYQKRGRERYEQYVAELRKKADVKILIDVTKESKG